MTPTAQKPARGLSRHLAQAGYSTLTELIRPNGRRADVIGIDRAGGIAVVEIKTAAAATGSISRRPLAFRPR